MTKKKDDFLFIEAVGFAIKLVFKPTDNEFQKALYLENLEKTLKEGGFTLSTKTQNRSKNIDFEIVVKSSPEGIKIIEKVGGRKLFRLFEERDFKNKKTQTFYSSGIFDLFLILQNVILKLVKKDGFLTHASGIGLKDKCFLFCAPSGGGKTTVSDLISGGNIFKFSDDRVAFRKINNRWFVFSIPVIEKKGIQKKLKSKNFSMIVLKKAKTTKIKEETEVAKKLKLLMNQHILVKENFTQKQLKIVSNFVLENKVYILENNLSKKDIIKALNEA